MEHKDADVTTLKVKQLKALIQAAGLSHADCFEKSDLCPVPLTVRGTQALVSFAPLAFKLFYAARQNAVLRRSPFPPP